MTIFEKQVAILKIQNKKKQQTIKQRTIVLEKGKKKHIQQYEQRSFNKFRIKSICISMLLKVELQILKFLIRLE